jgi:hypothetical protein
VRPLQHPLAVRREADEALPALDDRHAELLLELPDAARQRGLRHVAGLGRAGEVLLAGEGDEVLELTDIHGVRLASSELRADSHLTHDVPA